MRDIKKNYVLTSICQVFYIITPLITTPYVSRIFGAEGIGDYAFAFSVANYFALFIRLGVLNYGNRTIAAIRDDRERLAKTFSEIYALQLGCGLIVSFLYALWAIIFAPRIDLSMCLVAFILSAVLDVTWFLYGVEDFVVTTVRDIILRTIIVICTLVFVNSYSDLKLYTFIQAMGYLTCQILGWIRVCFFVRFIKPSIQDVIKHLKPNVILFVPTIAVSIYKIMDKIMLGLMSTTTELGYYESSEKIINVPLALITSLGIVMLPRMSHLYALRKEREEIGNIIFRSWVFVTFISSLLCFGIMSVANQFVPLFYGSGYEKCIDLFYYLLPSCVFLAFAQVIKTQYLMPLKMDKQFIISCFGGAGINLVLNILLIPYMASIGAAISTLVSEISVCLIQCWFVKRDLDLKKAITYCCPIILAGVLVFALFGTCDVKVGDKICSLFVKVFECGISYLIIAGLLVWITHCARKTIIRLKGVKNGSYTSE